MKKICITFILGLCFGIILCVSEAPAIPINLTTFDPYPNDKVDIALNGTSAVIREDDWFAPVSLENYGLFIPENALSLTFNYELVVGADNEDYFDFFILDLSIPDFWVGGDEGTYTGTYTYDLAPLRGETVPIVFDLMYGWGDGGYESYVKISSLDINPVPEPSTIILIAMGIIGLIGFKRRDIL